MLSELNNLRILDNSAAGKPEERKLGDEEREAAIAYLSKTQKPTLAGLKKVIGKLPDSPEAAQITFNLEACQRTGIGGLATNNKLSKVLGKKAWEELSEESKNKVVEALTLPTPGQKRLTQRSDEEIEELLEAIPGLSEEAMSQLAAVALSPGHCGLSIKALEKLLPHMRAGHVFQGKDESNSALHLAGYQRRDEFSGKVLPLLPPLDSVRDPNDTENFDPHFPEVNNPLVIRAINEMRKVVNAVIRKYGKPSRIHLEMARDLKMSSDQREKYIRRAKANQKEREEAQKQLEEYGVAGTRDAVLLYRLWEEQKRTCLLYTSPSPRD